MDTATHISVLSDEVLSWLQPRAGGRYFDGTLGLGGHSLRLFEATQGQIEILASDKDTRAITLARERLQRYKEHLYVAHASFRDFERSLKEIGWRGFDGVLLDLGVSSMQVDSPDRGFSFVSDGPLDMRMDKDSGTPSARQFIARATVDELKRVIWDYGEDPMGGRIARAIVKARELEPIETTLQLAAIVEKAYPPKRRALARNHPATKTFQAIRIAVNRELDDLRYFLERISKFLLPGGRIAVISFHSLEDRIVKQAFRKASKGCLCDRYQPICQCGHEQTLKILTKKPLVPTALEMRENPRSRSAKLRVAERVVSKATGGDLESHS